MPYVIQVGAITAGVAHNLYLKRDLAGGYFPIGTKGRATKFASEQDARDAATRAGYYGIFSANAKVVKA